MSILIKGMDMPKDKETILRIDEKGEVYIYGSYPTELYSAFELPPYGDLIDRDAFENEMRGVYCEYWQDVLRNMPTIIESEEEE